MNGTETKKTPNLGSSMCLYKETIRTIYREGKVKKEKREGVIVVHDVFLYKQPGLRFFENNKGIVLSNNGEENKFSVPLKPRTESSCL